VRSKRGRRANVAPGRDLVQSQFWAASPTQVWGANICEFPTGEGKLHVAGVRGLCHRGMVAWAMGPRPDAYLVVDAVVMTLGRCTPDPDGLVHHSDRGAAYVSFYFCTAVDLAGLQICLGRTGEGYDDAAMETVWSTIKRDIVGIRGSIWFDTRDEARLYLFELIEVFYNRQRHQTPQEEILGDPADFERAAPHSAQSPRSDVVVEVEEVVGVDACLERLEPLEAVTVGVLDAGGAFVGDEVGVDAVAVGFERGPGVADPCLVPVRVGVGWGPSDGDAHLEAFAAVTDCRFVVGDAADGATDSPAVDLGEGAGR
jgi:hypothetical protein